MIFFQQREECINHFQLEILVSEMIVTVIFMTHAHNLIYFLDVRNFPYLLICQKIILLFLSWLLRGLRLFKACRLQHCFKSKREVFWVPLNDSWSPPLQSDARVPQGGRVFGALNCHMMTPSAEGATYLPTWLVSRVHHWEGPVPGSCSNAKETCLRY